eukprot:CAMPEP_0197923286 /NCGR_PEP_ID=MMETSP1439-20131203/93718_1 /TAXON_ID=66791 /ORGANISM="Gonyaulax spinifera, Strain CCMP409" /LENGTH=30 /DNA_ID= /DNA_START= /DNA_END= /DNA_ORIENTATION=
MAARGRLPATPPLPVAGTVVAAAAGADEAS